jgi:hypothetical protein
MKIIITESHLNHIISKTTEMTESGSHQAKELKKLLEWSVKFLKCTIVPTKNGIKICPPDKIGGRCRPTHLSDKALFDVERDLAKWFDTTRQEIHLSYKSWRQLKKIVDDPINESIYAKRRESKIESFLEDSLISIDPLDYEDEFEYISEVAASVTDDLLSDNEDIEYDTKKFNNMFDEIYSFIRKQYYYKIQDHYDKVRTDY